MRLLNMRFERPLNMQKFCPIIELTRLIYRIPVFDKSSIKKDP